MSNSNFQENINKHGRNYIAGLRGVIGQLWEKVCKEEDIDPKSLFVITSNRNRFLPFYDRAWQMYREAKEEYRTGGYVGLTLNKRR